MCGMMDTMARDWARLGERLKAGRIARGMEQQEVAAELGVGRGAIWNIETGNVAKVTMTIKLYAKLIGWDEKSVGDVLDGGEPTLVAAPEAPAISGERAEQGAASDLSLAVQESLRTGPLLESRVQEVTTPSGRVRATIVIRGEDGQSQEELLAALRALTIEISAQSDERKVE
jgi:transcriptional regulator with XRE-family HTH domain